jgi:hypothetical protein
MSIFGKKISTVQLGQQFVKVGDRSGLVWEVSRLWKTVDGVDHARLISTINPSDTKAISICTIEDRQFFTPVNEIPTGY